MSEPKEFAILEDDLRRRLFVKLYARDASLEFRKSRALFEAARSSGEFRAPEPLHCAELEGVIIFEYIHGLIGCREYLIRELKFSPRAFERRSALMHKIGIALALAHLSFARLDLSGELLPFLPTPCGNDKLSAHVSQILGNSPQYPMHGDFSGGNLFLLEDQSSQSPQLVVIDPTSHPYLAAAKQREATASIYVDGGQFLFSILSNPRFFPPLAGEAERYVKHFVEGYREASGHCLDESTLLVCAATITRRYQEHHDTRMSRFSFSNWREKRFRQTAAIRLVRRAAQLLPKS